MPLPNPAQEIGKIIGLKGIIRAEMGEDSRVLEEGSPVYEGEKIVTGSGANVEIRFLDNTVLSQGPDAILSLDEYVFNPQDVSGSGLSFGLMKGLFRNVTGKIAEQNPERVNMESPSSLIGIRGTTTVHNISPDAESHGAEVLSPGHMMVIQDAFGEMRFITRPLTMIDVFPDRPMQFIRSMTPEELLLFRTIAPSTGDLESEPQPHHDDGVLYDDIAVTTDGPMAVRFPVELDLPGLEIQAGPEQMQSLQRVYQIEPANEGSAALLNQGLESSYDIFEPREEDFREIYISRSDDSDQDPTPDPNPPAPDPEPDPGPSPDPDPPSGPEGNPDYWETLAQHESDPDYSWFAYSGFQILADPNGDEDSPPLLPASDDADYAIFGFGGNDTIDVSTHSGSHYIFGGAGDDTIVTGPGDNIIYGGSGSDTIVVKNAGDASNDLIDGGVGDNDWNRLIFKAGGHLENLFPEDDQLKNINEIRFEEAAKGANLAGQSEDFDIYLNSNLSTTVVAGSGNYNIHAGFNASIIHAFDGGGNANRLNLLPLNDSIDIRDASFINISNIGTLSLSEHAGSEFRTVVGGTHFENAGFTHILGSDYGDTLDFRAVGPGRNLIIVTGSGTNVIDGGGGDDTIVVSTAGSANDDVIDGGGGVNRLVFLAGTHTQNMPAVDAGIINIQEIRLEEAATGINLTGQSEGFSIYVNPGLSSTVTGGVGNDTFYISDVSIDHAIYGGGGANRLVLMPGTELFDDYFVNMSSIYTLSLQTDHISQIGHRVTGGTNFGNTGFHSVEGSDYNDILNFEGAEVSDLYLSIDVGMGNNVVTGGVKPNEIFTGPGVNTITGGPSNDTIVATGAGHAGNDIIDGGGGTFNRLILRAGDHQSNNFPVDLNLENIREITLEEGASGVNLFAQSDDFEVYLNSGLSGTIISGTGDNIIEGGAGNDTIFGNVGNDQYYGGDGINTLDYSRITDLDYHVRVTLDPASPFFADNGIWSSHTFHLNDHLIYDFQNVVGSSGDDTIIGNDQGNRITGGPGADMLWGGGGSNVFVYNSIDDSPYDGYDIIYDFYLDALNILEFNITAPGEEVLWVGDDGPEVDDVGKKVMGYNLDPNGIELYYYQSYDPAEEFDMVIYLENQTGFGEDYITGMNFVF